MLSLGLHRYLHLQNPLLALYIVHQLSSNERKILASEKIRVGIQTRGGWVRSKNVTSVLSPHTPPHPSHKISKFSATANVTFYMKSWNPEKFYYTNYDIEESRLLDSYLNSPSQNVSLTLPGWILLLGELPGIVHTLT